MEHAGFIGGDWNKPEQMCMSHDGDGMGLLYVVTLALGCCTALTKAWARLRAFANLSGFALLTGFAFLRGSALLKGLHAGTSFSHDSGLLLGKVQVRCSTVTLNEGLTRDNGSDSDVARTRRVRNFH